ncbi:hypothetical protein ALI22I_31655 [Saccharothrix sp. ALI-22-I]|nr:hypothetical protein ALI22I_31655 [Saccharothrix sp. ALI-22-I]
MLADRWDRRKLMLLVSLAQAVTLLPLLTGDLVLLNVVAAVQVGLAALFEPAKNALLPTLVPREQVPAANGLVGLSSNLARLVGASLGGLILGYAGLPGVVLADVVSFLLAAALLATLGTRDSAREAGKPAWRAWLDGLREIRGPLRPMVAAVGLMAMSQACSWCCSWCSWPNGSAVVRPRSGCCAVSRRSAGCSAVCWSACWPANSRPAGSWAWRC